MTHIVYPQTIACSANNTKLKFFFSASLPGLCLALNISAQSTPSSCLPSPPGTGNSQSVLNIKYHIQIVRYSINQNDIRDANNGFNTRLVPVAIVVFRYLMVCHAVSCQNLGGERRLWRVVSWWWWFWFWCWWCCWNILKMFLDGPYAALAWWRAAPSLVHPKFWWWQWCCFHCICKYGPVFPQIWTCMVCLCLASGSLIFFTSDISLTYLLCTGREERFR